MNCHACDADLDWDGVSPIVMCDACCTYRFADTPDGTGNRIVSLNRPGHVCCPICRRRLSEVAMEGLKVEHCMGCRGAFMPEDVFAMLVRNRREEFRDAAVQPIFLLDEQRISDVHCPICRVQMSRHPCFGPSLLVIDSCLDCGTAWVSCPDTAASRTSLPLEAVASAEQVPVGSW